jgi:uncharacterized protein (TIGR01777 family)
MQPETFTRPVDAPVAVGHLWDWHMRPGAFERLAPAWQRLLPGSMPVRIAEGEVADFRLAAGPVKLRWVARLGPVEPPYRFVDTQLRGPFASWRHEHLFEPLGDGRSRLTDRVSWALPAALAAVPGVRGKARRELARLFAFRHQRMTDDLARHRGGRPGAGRTLLVSGSGGLIGSRLVPYLRTLGYTVRGLTRGRGGDGVFRWDPSAGWVDPEALQGVDAVIHLAGEGIADGRWTAARRARILRSRVDGTRTLVEAMAAMQQPPAALISASGVNFYPSGEAGQDETSPGGNGFLAEVCRAWEAEAARAGTHGIRVVIVRTGVVLDPLGGALGKLLPLFRMGLGGRVGSGRQAFPWIAMDDLLDVYACAVADSGLEGPVNAVHPERVTNARFSRTLGEVLRRPALLPVPAWAIRAGFGRMGEETLLASLDIRPRVLESAGFAFRQADLKSALAFMLGR